MSVTSRTVNRQQNDAVGGGTVLQSSGGGAIMTDDMGTFRVDPYRKILVDGGPAPAAAAA